MTLASWLFGPSPFRSSGTLGPERAFPGIPGPPSRVAERAPRTALSLGSGRSGFSQLSAFLGAKLLLLPREAHRGAEAALGLGQSTAPLPPPFARWSVTLRFSILLPLSASRLRGLFPGCTQSSPGDLTQRGGARHPPAEDLVESQAPTPRPKRRQPLVPPTLLPGLAGSGNRSWRPRRTLAGGVPDAAALLPL